MLLLISPVALDSAVAYVISAVGVAWAPAVVMISAVSGVSAAAIGLTEVEIPGVPAVTRVSAVAPVPTAVDVPFAVGVSKVSGSLMLLTSLQ